MIYPIRHSSVVLLENPQLKSFTSKAEAQTLLQQFDLDKETLGILIQEGDWQTSPSGWGESKQTKKLVELILADKMVITQRKAPEPPKVESLEPAPDTTVGNRQAGLGPETPEGLHNQEWDKVEVKEQSFKPVKQVDMDDLAEDEKIAARALERQGRKDYQIKQVLNSGNDFATKELKPGDKLYGFDSSANKYGTKKQDSMYWLDETGYKNVKSKYFKNGTWDKEGVKNQLALPCMNRADVIDVAEVTAPQKAIASNVGKAREQIAYSKADNSTGMLGKIMPGGGKQITPDPSKTSAVTRLKGTP